MPKPNYPILQLKKGREASLMRRHPWVFSGALVSEPKGLNDGDLVQLAAKNGDILATAYFNKGSIAAKVLSFEDSLVDQSFIIQKLNAALQYRQLIGLINNSETNVFRLVNGEGDGLPGLIIDYYNESAVVQCHSWGMYHLREIIYEALQQLDLPITSIYLKSNSSLPKSNTKVVKDSFILGNTEHAEVSENGRLFKVDIVNGQKTGFFIDQRDNRLLLGRYTKDKSVLNTFSYTGGFSIYAHTVGADKVVSVDSSRTASELTTHNHALNPSGKGKTEVLTEDVFDYLIQNKTAFDLIVLDPPAFAKSKHKSHNAVQAYKRLNRLAMKKIKSGGIIFTFSCSQVIDRTLFEKTVYSAALEANRNIRIIHRLGAAPCHPVSIYHPEGSYLKGLVLAVE